MEELEERCVTLGQQCAVRYKEQKPYMLNKY